MVSPVVRRGRVIAFVGSIAHVSDVGGHSGDIEALDVFQEGLRLPPCKLWTADGPNEQLFEVIAANCRVPDLVLGDLRAMIGTHRLGAHAHPRAARRLRARRPRRRRGRAAPPLRARDPRPHRGAARTARTSSASTSTATTSASICTRRSRSPAATSTSTTPAPRRSRRPPRSTASTTPPSPRRCSRSSARSCRRSRTTRRSSGRSRSTAPEGSILNARFPAPVKTRAKTTNNLNQVIFGAMWPVFGERAQAGSGSIWPFTLRGDEAPYGRFVVDMLPHGGRGATTELDGMIPVAFPHNSVVTPVEIMETKAPVLFLEEGAAARLGRRRAAARRARPDDRVPARRPRGHRAQHHPGQDRDVPARPRGRRARRARRRAAERRGAGALPRDPLPARRRARARAARRRRLRRAVRARARPRSARTSGWATCPPSSPSNLSASAPSSRRRPRSRSR